MPRLEIHPSRRTVLEGFSFMATTDDRARARACSGMTGEKGNDDEKQTHK